MNIRKLFTRKNRKGSALIEFGLIAPVMMAMSFGVMDFARIYRQAIVTTASTRAGLEFASKDAASASNFTGIEAAVRADAGDPNSTDTNWPVNVSEVCACAGSTSTPAACTTVSCSTTRYKYVKIEASKPFETVLMVPFFPSSTTINSVSYLRVE